MGCCRVTDLRRKEVISSKNGCRIGFVDDVEVDTVTAKLVSVIIFGRPRCFGLLGKEENIIIHWENIRLIGEDTILVDHCLMPHSPRKWKIPFFH